jgi:hypothetical protein
LADTAASQLKEEQKSATKTKDALRVEEALKKRPPLERILNLAELEVRGTVVLFSPIALMLVLGSRTSDPVA